MLIRVGDLDIELDGKADALSWAGARYASFLVDPAVPGADAGPMVHLEIPDWIGGQYARPRELNLALRGPVISWSDEGVRGEYDTVTRRGCLSGAVCPADLDALLRLALALTLPQDGALLLHGAALTAPAVALCGASGAGKTTAAAALGGACDEWVVLRPNEDGVTLHSTPYWRGRPFNTQCRAVFVLGRGGAPGVRPLTGVPAVHALLERSVQPDGGRSERRLFELAASICRSVRVVSVHCPEGDRYLPFLESALQDVAA